MLTRRAAALCWLSMLGACGGAGQSDAAPTAGCVAGGVRVQLFGDSTQWGWDGASASGARAAVYPELALQNALDQRFGAGRVAVTTRAVSGTRAGDLLAGTDGLNLPWPGSVQADIVVINFGINDRRGNVPAAQYEAQLRQLAAAPATVVLQTPLPVRDSPTAAVNDSYAPNMRAVATALGLPLADAAAYAASMPDWFVAWAPDLTHPSSAGYAAIEASAVAPVVAALVVQRLCAR